MHLPILTLAFWLCVAPSMIFSQTAKITYEEYIAKYSATAIANMKQYRIPASITLAQALLESGAGNSDLARNANNHFGIKCHKGWTGETYLKDDDAKNECFRKYKDPSESFNDHALFLSTRSRYASLFELEITDYKGWAHGLKAAGYATNPKYAERLIDLIGRYDLAKFDTADTTPKANPRKRKREKVEHAKPTPAPQEKTSPSGTIQGRQIQMNNGVKYMVVREGETLKTMADDIQLRTWMLRKYNDLGNNDTIYKGDKIYLQSKKRKAQAERHTVKPGETLHAISQQHGIKLKSLCKMNQLSPDVTVTPGTILKMR